MFWSHRSDDRTKMRPKHAGQLQASAEHVSKDTPSVHAGNRPQMPIDLRNLCNASRDESSWDIRVGTHVLNLSLIIKWESSINGGAGQQPPDHAMGRENVEGLLRWSSTGARAANLARRSIFGPPLPGAYCACISSDSQYFMTELTAGPALAEGWQAARFRYAARHDQTAFAWGNLNFVQRLVD